MMEMKTSNNWWSIILKCTSLALERGTRGRGSYHGNRQGKDACPVNRGIREEGAMGEDTYKTFAKQRFHSFLGKISPSFSQVTRLSHADAPEREKASAIPEANPKL